MPFAFLIVLLLIVLNGVLAMSVDVDGNRVDKVLAARSWTQPVIPNPDESISA